MRSRRTAAKNAWQRLPALIKLPASCLPNPKGRSSTYAMSKRATCRSSSKTSATPGRGDGRLPFARPGRLRRALGEDHDRHDQSKKDDRCRVRCLSGFPRAESSRREHQQLDSGRKARSRLLARPRLLGPRHRDRSAHRLPPPGTDPAALRQCSDAQHRLAPRPAKMRLHHHQLRRRAIQRNRCSARSSDAFLSCFLRLTRTTGRACLPCWPW